MARDDFSDQTRRTLAARVGHGCSRPDCRASTSGPQQDDTKALNLGVAAHITAASPGGPRYDSSLSSEQRSEIGNAIWLCQNCAKLIDNDPARFTVDLLRAWKLVSEDEAINRVGMPRPIVVQPAVIDKWIGYGYIEEAGVAGDLRSQGYTLQWVHAPNLHAYVELKGWEIVEYPEKSGQIVRFKVRELDCEFMILMKKKS